MCLDASRPWLCYWMLHSLSLLRALPSDETMDRIIDTLSRCQNQSGGFGGGPQQLSHCAPTYASVLALITTGKSEAYDAIDRASMYRFFMSMKTEDGAFRMHDDGESDTRSVYTALCVASVLNILTPEMKEGVAEWLSRCQT